MKKYEWKIKGFGKGVEVNTVVQEFDRITTVYGVLTPEIILSEADKPESILHTFFQWEDDKAAHAYRLQQARQLLNNIEINIISSGEERTIGAYEVVTAPEGRTYKNVDVLTKDEADEVRQSTLVELNRTKQKLAFFSKFKKPIEYIDQAIEELKT